MRYDELVKLLPIIMQEPQNSINVKNILKIYDEATSDIVDKVENYGDLLDIERQTGSDLDYIGILYATPREASESDEDFRNRILASVVKKNTSSSLTDIQEALDAITQTGTLHVKNNYRGDPASVYITGTAKEKYIGLAFEVVKLMIGAGISVTIPIYSFGTWQNVKDQFNDWQIPVGQNYIW